MRKAYFLLLAALAVLLAGCGGGGGGSNQVTRYMVGYVYVQGDGGGVVGNDAIIVPTSVAPAGYVVPTSGTVTLETSNGTLVGRAPAEYSRDMADGNDIIVTVKANEGTDVEFSATALVSPTATNHFLPPFTVDIGEGDDDKTTLAIN